MPLTFLPTHNEGVNKSREAELVWLLLIHWVSVFPKQADCQFVNSASLVNPDTIEGTFPKFKQDICQWDFSVPIWVTWNLSLVV